MSETAADRRAARDAAAAAKASDEQASELEGAQGLQEGASRAPGAEQAPQSQDDGQEGAQEAQGATRTYRATAPLPSPDGGAHAIGDLFEATDDDPRVKSHFSKLHTDDGDAAPAAVVDALGTPAPDAPAE